MPFIQQACLSEDHLHHYPGKAREYLGASGTAPYGSQETTHLGRQENLELHHNNLPHSVSGGQGKVEGQ